MLKMTSEDIINRHKNKIKAQQGVDFLSKLPSYKKKTLEEKIQDKINEEKFANIKVADVKTKNIGKDRPLTKKEIEEKKFLEMKAKQGDITQYTPQSLSSKTWEVISNPLTASGYAVRGENLPDNFSRGERNKLDMAVDVINPAFYANEVKHFGSNIKEGTSNLSQGEFSKAGDNFLGAGMNALSVLPLALEYKTISNGLSKTYNLNPLAKKGFNDAEKSYRVAGMDSYDDFLNVGGVRSNRALPENATMMERIEARSTSFPSFQKGYADMSYLPKGEGVVYETAIPTFKRGELNPVTKEIIKGRHYAHRPIDLNTGNVITEIPASDVRVFSGKPHWLKGYTELPKVRQQGGTITENENKFLEEFAQLKLI